MEEFKDGPVITRESLALTRGRTPAVPIVMVVVVTRLFWIGLVQSPPGDPRASSLLFPSYAGLPPAIITYNGHDPLRDDGRVLEKVLREAGVKTRGIL